jgi:hypothetical protein
MQLPPTEFFYERAMKRSKAIKARANAQVELEAVEQAAAQAFSRREYDALKGRAEELNRRIRELSR